MNLPPCCWLTCTAFGFCAASGGAAMLAQPASKIAAETATADWRIGSTKHGFIVFAKRRCRFCEWWTRAVERQRQADQFEIAVRPLLDHAERPCLRIGDDLVERVDRAVRNSGGFEQLRPFGSRSRRENLGQDRDQLGAVHDPVAVSAKTRVFGEAGTV